MDIESDAANPGTAAALVDEAMRADSDVVELFGDLEYHFGVVRPDAEGGVFPEDVDGCSLYLVCINIERTMKYSFNKFVKTPLLKAWCLESPSSSGVQAPDLIPNPSPELSRRKNSFGRLRLVCSLTNLSASFFPGVAKSLDFLSFSFSVLVFVLLRLESA
jgi:hypothetical protein